MHAVEVVDLVKRYRRGATPAVDGLSFAVRRGEVFGLLGPNGAGKTTTVGVLTTRVLPTSGKATIHGVDVLRAPSQARQLLAVVSQRNNLDRSLNVRQNLLFHAIYHGVAKAERTKRADEILDRMGLAEQAKERIDVVSGGQAQRVMIARALMHDPRVLFLDEPSTGLDPQARLFVHERIAELRAEGVTIVLTTHDMDEAAKLSDRVGIVDHGKLLALDTPTALTHSLPGSATLNLTVGINGKEPATVRESLSTVDGVQRAEQTAGETTSENSSGDSSARFRLYTAVEPTAVLPSVLKSLGALGVDPSDLSIGTPSLEDVFIHLTGRELR